MTGGILLIRHGETEWNLQRRYQGAHDSPLTERGISQAEAIGRLLGVLPETASAPVVASPLGRARRTAEIIAAHFSATPELRLDDRLRELSLGSWDGLTYGELAARYPGLFDGKERHDWYFRAPDGEGYDAFAARLSEWLGDQNLEQVSVVVAHGLVSRVLRGLYAGLAREVALSLPVPQDRVYRLASGAIEELRLSSLGV